VKGALDYIIEKAPLQDGNSHLAGDQPTMSWATGQQGTLGGDGFYTTACHSFSVWCPSYLELCKHGGDDARQVAPCKGAGCHLLAHHTLPLQPLTLLHDKRRESKGCSKPVSVP
jgi:hypothetical protein